MLVSWCGSLWFQVNTADRTREIFKQRMGQCKRHVHLIQRWRVEQPTLIKDTHFIWQGSFLIPTGLRAVDWVGNINRINELTASGQQYLSYKIMTKHLCNYSCSNVRLYLPPTYKPTGLDRSIHNTHVAAFSKLYTLAEK